MKLIVFGATGTIGRQLVAQALAQSHHVTAFARHPDALASDHPNLMRRAGDVLDRDAVMAAVDGHDSVLIALGAGRKGGVRAIGIRHVVAAMQRHGVRRLVCMSTLGAGDSRALLNFFWKRIMFGLLLKDAYADHQAQEAIVRESGLDWALIDGPETAEKFAGALRSRPRAAWGWNSISNAIAFGQRMIETNDYEGLRKIIDVSADAGQFGGMPLPLARAEALAAGITINGLAILREGSTRAGLGGPSLETFFESQVIGGFGAFVITADSETSFAEAVRNKLLLEIAAGPHNTPTGLQQASLAD